LGLPIYIVYRKASHISKEREDKEFLESKKQLMKKLKLSTKDYERLKMIIQKEFEI